MRAEAIDDNFNETSEFKSAIKWSLIAHVVIVGIFTIKGVFFKSESINYSSAVRVDIIALPDKLDPKLVTLEKPSEPQKKEKASKPEAKPVKKAKEPDTINLKKLKSKETDAFNKLKAQEAIDKIKNEVAQEKSEKESLKKISQVKGNVLSAGTALTGLDQLQHDSYISSLDHRIKEHWTLPEWLAKQDLSAQVRVRIDENGQIISREIVKSSGNKNYDEIVLETIDQSAPFPPPPDKFVTIVGVNGVLIGFPE